MTRAARISLPVAPEQGDESDRFLELLADERRAFALPPRRPELAERVVHGGRGVESRLTVEGMNISNPPGGNQPPNYVADIGNASEVTMTTSGGLGESETAGLTMNIVPRQGGNSLSGLFFASGFSEGMQSDNFTEELQSRGAREPATVFRVYDVNGAVGGPIVAEGRLWGAMLAASTREPSLPPDTEERMSQFTELMATAIANAESQEARAVLTERGRGVDAAMVGSLRSSRESAAAVVVTGNRRVSMSCADIRAVFRPV